MLNSKWYNDIHSHFNLRNGVKQRLSTTSTDDWGFKMFLCLSAVLLKCAYVLWPWYAALPGNVCVPWSERTIEPDKRKGQTKVPMLLSGNSNHFASKKTVKTWHFPLSSGSVSHILIILSKWKVTHIVPPHGLPHTAQWKHLYKWKVSICDTQSRACVL